MKQGKNKFVILKKILKSFPVLCICVACILTNSLNLGAVSADTISADVTGILENEIYIEQTIKIRNIKEFQKVAEHCSLDSWSRHKKIVLENDLDFSDVSFVSIPTFGGVFDGQGHMISGLELTESLSPAGLFGLVQEGAVVKNLQLVGNMEPSGTANHIGGIAGINEGLILNCSVIGTINGQNNVGGIAGVNKYTGVVQNCRTEGSITGENRTGGIVGYNQGSIEKCKNDMSVNNDSVDPVISVDDLNIGTITDVTQLNGLEITDVADDVGGIAGYSIGKILSCHNKGAIGYEHIGYNIGGIAGRSCGFVYACSNEGEVSGRKDVGGIIGQMEPYIQVTLTESGIAKIKRELDTLNGLLDTAEKHLDSSTYKAEKELKETRKYLQQIEKILEEDKQDAYGQNIELTDTLTKMTLMAMKLEALAADMTADAGVLGRDLAKISKQSVKLSETLESVEEELENTDISDYIADTSHINIEDMIYGKAVDILNLGKIYGDSNVGGVAGNMAPDDELDPEDEVVQRISLSEDRKYEYKALIIKAANKGTIVAKKDFAGGICGRTDIGMITDCEGYGTVYSEAGEYVGGIAGLNGSKIQRCFVKGNLSGDKYVGGITGGSIAENVSGAYGLVSSCYSMVEILQCQQFFGAIAGIDGGEYTDCYFVSDKLQGINRISYEGKAESITYKQLLQVKGLPEAFEQEDLTAADGKQDMNIPEPYLTALDGEPIREDGRPVFLAEGQFRADALLQIEEKDVNYTPETNALKDMLYQIRVPEQWKVKLPEDALLIHSVRYLPAEESTGEIALYVKQDGKWKAADWEQKGSYLQFYISGTEAEIAVVTVTGLWQLWLLYGIIACVLIGGVVWMMRRKRNILKVLLWIMAVVILLVAVFVAAVLVKGKFKQGTEAYRILKTYLEQPEQAMNLTVEVKTGEEEHTLEAEIFCTELEGKKVTCIRQSGIHLFYADGILFLDNGKAFQTSEISADYGALLENLMLLYEHVDFETEKDGKNSTYTMTLKEESLQSVSEYLLPSEEKKDLHAEKLKVTLRAVENVLSDMTFTGAGSVSSEQYKVTAVLEPVKIKAGRIEVPEEVKTALLSENPKVEDIVTADVFRLYAAWKNLYEADPLGAQIYLQADCGPLSLAEDVTLISVTEEDMQIHCLEKNDYKIFFTEDTVCSEKGYAVTSSKAEAIQVADLLAVAYELCLNGTFSSVESDGRYIYTLALEEAAMQDIAKMITSESTDKGIRFENGSIRIRVADEKAESITFTCDGTLDVLLTKVPVAFSAELDVSDQEKYKDFTVPEKVREAVNKK